MTRQDIACFFSPDVGFDRMREVANVLLMANQQKGIDVLVGDGDVKITSLEIIKDICNFQIANDKIALMKLTYKNQQIFLREFYGVMRPGRAAPYLFWYGDLNTNPYYKLTINYTWLIIIPHTISILFRLADNFNYNLDFLGTLFDSALDAYQKLPLAHQSSRNMENTFKNLVNCIDSLHFYGYQPFRNTRDIRR